MHRSLQAAAAKVLPLTQCLQLCQMPAKAQGSRLLILMGSLASAGLLTKGTPARCCAHRGTITTRWTTLGPWVCPGPAAPSWCLYHSTQTPEVCRSMRKAGHPQGPLSAQKSGLPSPATLLGDSVRFKLRLHPVQVSQPSKRQCDLVWLRLALILTHKVPLQNRGRGLHKQCG